MRYQEFPPPPPLRRHVECFWILEAGGSEPCPPQRILPDGCSEVIFHYGDRFRRLDGPAPERQPATLLVGQALRHTLIQPAGRAGVLGARFRPAGLHAFLPVPQHELTARILDLQLAWPALHREVDARVREARTTRARVAALARALAARLRPGGVEDDHVSGAVDAIVSAGGLVSLDALARSTGLGARQLQRRFRSAVGLGPKAFARIIRFQCALKAIDQPVCRWIDVALDGGYYDQAHFVHDFRDIVGLSPSAFFGEDRRLAAFFTRAQRPA